MAGLKGKFKRASSRPNRIATADEAKRSGADPVAAAREASVAAAPEERSMEDANAPPVVAQTASQPQAPLPPELGVVDKPPESDGREGISHINMGGAVPLFMERRLQQMSPHSQAQPPHLPPPRTYASGSGSTSMAPVTVVNHTRTGLTVMAYDEGSGDFSKKPLGAMNGDSYNVPHGTVVSVFASGDKTPVIRQRVSGPMNLSVTSLNSGVIGEDKWRWVGIGAVMAMGGILAIIGFILLVSYLRKRRSASVVV